MPDKTPLSQSLLIRCLSTPLSHCGVITLPSSSHSLGCVLAHFSSRSFFGASSVGLENVLLQLDKSVVQVVVDDNFVVEAFDLGLFDLLDSGFKPLLDSILVICGTLAQTLLQLLQARRVEEDESSGVRLVFELLDALFLVSSCLCAR